MAQQAVVEAQPQTDEEATIQDLEARVANLEAEVTELRTALNQLLAASEGPLMRFYREREAEDPAYSWIEPPDHLKGVTDYSQLDPEELVYIHELTDEDIRRRLEQLERWYGMSSEKFYRRWQQGDVDEDVYVHKTEWSLLYESWQRLQRESSSSGKVDR